MYENITFPTVATDVVRFADFDVSVDPTFACVVVKSSFGFDVFRYDDDAQVFVFVCASVVEGGADFVPEMKVIQDALCELMPWLTEEVAVVRQAWIEFFDGARQMPVLTLDERRSLASQRMWLVAGVSGEEGRIRRAIKPDLELVCA
jgi:hypothetical protein